MSNNNTFTLSIAAQNVEHSFYNKKGIVYVEGEDDIHFWSQYFNPSEFEIRQVNGCKNLEDYENDILYHGLRCIVARDSDYSAYMGKTNKHPLIVCTLSHSIECIMFCPYNVNACLKKFAKTLDDHVEEIKSIYDEFYNDIKEILIYDIANNVFRIGCNICGDSCVRFLQSNSSVKVSADKRDKFLQTKSTYFSPIQIAEVRERVNKDARELRQIAKGHFQTSFVINLIKKMTSSITQNDAPSISKEALYALLVKCFPECKVDCIERKYIKQRVKAAVTALSA